MAIHCPFCNYPIEPENVLFKYMTESTTYRDMRRYSFYRLCTQNWQTEERFDGLYFLASDDLQDSSAEDKKSLPTSIRVKLCDGKTPTELEAMELPGEPLSQFETQYNNKTMNQNAPSASEPAGSTFTQYGNASSAADTSKPAGDASSVEFKPKDDGSITVLGMRACPNCHNELHPKFGQIPTIKVSLLGGPSAGKTAFMLALTHQLDNQLVSHGLGTASLLKASQLYYELLNTSYQDLKATIATTKDERLFPFVFHYSNDNNNGAKECFVIFYDIAGESTTTTNALLNHRGTMEASTLLLLLDPNQLNAGYFYNSTAASQNGTTAATQDGKEGDSTQFYKVPIESFIQKSIADNKDLGAFRNIKSVITVFSKMDQVLQANRDHYDAGRMDTTCKIRFDLGEDHMNALDVGVIREITNEMEAVISSALNRKYSLRGLLKQKFPNADVSTILGVSTYSLSDSKEITFENRCEETAPKHRIIEPFLCILGQNGMIPLTSQPDSNVEPPQPKKSIFSRLFSH